MATEGKLPTLGFGAGAIGFVVLLGFSPQVSGPTATADVIVQIPADDYVVRMPADDIVVQIPVDDEQVRL